MVLVEPIPPRRRVGLRMQFEAGRWRGGIYWAAYFSLLRGKETKRSVLQ